MCESRCIHSGVAPAARRDVNAQDVGSVPGEEKGQVALAAAGVKDFEAGNIARETEQTAGEPGQEATQRNFAYKAVVGLDDLVVAVYLGSVHTAPLSIDVFGLDCMCVPHSRPVARVESPANKPTSEAQRWLDCRQRLNV